MSGRARHLLELVGHLVGDEGQKQRLKVIFAVLIGELSVNEACELLGLCASRYYELRQQVLEAALQSLSPHPAGRPRAVVDSQEVEHLSAMAAEHEREMHLMRVREELLLTVPRVVRENERSALPGQKGGARKLRRRVMRGKHAT
ncbi:MAG: hypothetical protein IT454_21910 [Planctomycetes bacterium]|nr:hypothetical protein [Planctomycetota bacterium]